MKRSRKQKKHESQQKNAINYLSLISGRETGYLQDWAKINEIKQLDMESSGELPRQNVDNLNPEIKLNFATIGNQQPRPVQRQRHTHFSVFKRKIEVQVENFANVPHRKFCGKISRATLHELGKFQNKSQNNEQKLEKIQESNQQPRVTKEQENKNHRDPPNQLTNSISMNYIEKIRRLSLPWLKNLPKLDKSLDKDFDKQIKARQETRRLNQLIKNKMRRKHSNKYLIHKKLSEIESVEKTSKKNQNTQQNQNEKQSHEIKLLKSWLDYNRSKKKRSISSLLTEHFQNKYLEKKKQRQRAMVIKSAKAISVLSNNYQLKFH